MTSYVGVALRRFVIARAGGLCEYCLIHQDDAFYGCQVEHIISEKHGGESIAENLALACVYCNRYKGSDVGSTALETKQFWRFFHPREDKWSAHFELNVVIIRPLTEIGAVTARILRLNDVDRILERQELASLNRYPNELARQRMT